MALESGTYINSLNASNPASTDGLGQADDHLRLIKSTLLATLPNVAGAITADHSELSTLDGYTGNTADLNILSGAAAAGVTATELQYLDGVTSDIQTQINTINAASGAANDTQVTIQAGTLLGGGGSFTTNQTSQSTLTINHDAVSRTNTTSTAAPAAGNTFTAIDQITSDSSGHITGVRTKTVTMPASAAGGIALSDLSVGAEGTASGNGGLSYNNSTGVFTYSPPTAAGLGALTAHPNISAASSSSNSGNTFIQDITVDSNGHITAIATGSVSGLSTSFGDVGTYAFLAKSSAGTISGGSTYLGSTLKSAGFLSTSDFNDNTAMDRGSNSPAGTWRAMGNADQSSSRIPSTLFVRIS
jgi:hypothetical protein